MEMFAVMRPAIFVSLLPSCDVSSPHGLCSELPVTCAVGMECAVNYYLGAMGCCPTGYLQSCQLATACIDYAYLGSCDFACQADYAIGKWFDRCTLFF